MQQSKVNIHLATGKYDAADGRRSSLNTGFKSLPYLFISIEKIVLPAKLRSIRMRLAGDHR